MEVQVGLLISFLLMMSPFRLNIADEPAMASPNGVWSHLYLQKLISLFRFFFFHLSTYWCMFFIFVCLFFVSLRALVLGIKLLEVISMTKKNKKLERFCFRLSIILLCLCFDDLKLQKLTLWWVSSHTFVLCTKTAIKRNLQYLKIDGKKVCLNYRFYAAELVW